MPPTTSLKRRLVGGFSAQSLSILARTAQQILLVPLYVSVWGVELYQEWLVLTAWTGFVLLLDLGVQNYFGNAVLVAVTRGETARAEHLARSAFSLYLVVLGAGFAALVAAALTTDPSSLFGTGLMSAEEARTTFLLFATSVLILVPQGLINSFYRAHGEFGRGVNVMTGCLVLQTGFVVAALVAREPPAYAAAGYLAGAALTWLFMIVDQRRRYRFRGFGLSWPSRGELAPALRTAPIYTVATLGQQLLMSAPVIVLAHLAGPGEVVVFTVLRTLAGIVRQFGTQLCHSAAVEMTRQTAQGDQARLRLLYRSTDRLIGGLFGLLGGLTLVFGDRLVELWTRTQVTFSLAVFATFIAATLGTAPSQPSQTLLHYSNKPTGPAAALLSSAVLGSLFCLLAVPAAGALGAGLAVAAGELLCFGLALPFLASRAFGLPFTMHLVIGWGAGVLGLAIGTVAALVAQWLAPAHTVVGLALAGTIWAALVAPATVFVLLNHETRLWARGWVSRQRAARGARLGPSGSSG